VRVRMKAAATTALVTAALVVTPEMAMAAQYDGVMASATSCGTGATTKREIALSHGSPLGTVVARVELRYSSRCNTTWTRVKSTVLSADQLWGAVIRNSDGRSYWCSEYAWSSNLGANYCLTPMMNRSGTSTLAYGGADLITDSVEGWTSNF
jgi:hypothetical protein